MLWRAPQRPSGVAHSGTYPYAGGELFADHGEVPLSDLARAARALGWDAVVGWAVEDQPSQIVRAALLEGMVALRSCEAGPALRRFAAALSEGTEALDELVVLEDPLAGVAALCSDMLR